MKTRIEKFFLETNGQKKTTKYYLRLYLITFMLFLINPVFIQANSETTLSDSDRTIPIELEQVGSILTKSNQSLVDYLYTSQPVNVNLKTPTFSNVKVGDDITVKYRVEISDLYESISKDYEEVVLIVDNSQHIYGKSWDMVKRFFIDSFADELINSDLKVGLVPLQDQVDNHVQFETSHLLDTNNLQSIKDAFLNDSISASQWNPYRGLDPALKKAVGLLDDGFHSNKKQAIILISSGYVDINWPDYLEEVRRKEQTIISVSIDNGNQQVSGTSMESVHYSLGGKKSDFLTAYTDGQPDITSTLTTAIRRVSFQDQSMLSKQSSYDLSSMSLNNFDEVIFAIDASNQMVGSRWETVKDFFKNYFEYSPYLADKKLGIIPFHNGIESPNISAGNQTDFNRLLDLNDSRNIEMIRDAFGNNYIYANSNQSGRIIDNVLEKATQLLGNQNDRRQAVVFISTGDYTVNWSGNIENFAKLGYRIITLDLGGGKQEMNENSAYNVHKKMGGVEADYLLVDLNQDPLLLETLKTMFGVNKIPDTSVPGENPLKALELRFDLGDKFEVVDGLESKGDTYIYPIGELKFKVEGGKYIYEPIEVEFTVKVKEVERTFTFNSAQLAYKYGSETFTIQDISKPIFSTVDSGGITIQVNDSSGNLDHSYNSANKLIDDQILNRFGQQYNLYGDSFANIKLEGDHLNHIEYQVIQSNQTPDFPQDNWTPYTVGKDGIINEDIDLEHQGFLTQKSYNVSHMPTLTGNAQWSNRDLVFQTPFDEVKYKPTTVATTKDEYVTRVEYIDENGRTQVRWETNSIFTENQTISREYKEATKSWGYFKAPKTGYYEFKTYTDDGMKATLTLEDESQFTIIDAFYPKGAGNGSVSSSRVYLEEGKFYPIYIEYFNWGGDAAFKYEYRVSQNANTQTPPNTKFESIPSDAFYPSKSKNPGEGSNNIFVGQSGIKIPNEIGRYYILYKAGTSDEDGSNFEETFRGIYGPFNVEDRFQLTRSVVDSEAIYKQGDIVSFKYIIQPRDILITDLYKTESALNGPIAEQLVVTNALFKDTLPAGLTIEKLISTDITNHVINVDVNGNISISGPINHDIVYTLKRDPDNLANSKYEAKPITIFIEVQATDYGEFNFTNRAGALSYNDVTLEANKLGATKDSFFAETLLEIEQSSEIIKHGLFTNGSGTDFIEEISPVTKVVKEMNYTFGVTMDIKASTSSFIIEIPRYIQNATVMLKDSTISLYELTDSGTVDKTTKQLIPSANVLTKTDLTQIMSNVEESLIGLEKGKKYLLTYDLSFTESIGLSAYTSTIDVLGKVDVTHKEIRLELLQNDNNLEDKLYLPDLL